jgi:hypothetical protein
MLISSEGTGWSINLLSPITAIPIFELKRVMQLTRKTLCLRLDRNGKRIKGNFARVAFVRL